MYLGVKMSIQNTEKREYEVVTLKILTISELEDLTGKNYRTIKKRLGDLEPVRTKGTAKYYNAKEAISLVFTSEEAETQYDLNKERARLAAMQADRNKLDYMKQVGTLVSSDHVMTGLTNLFAAIRARFLELPVTAAPGLVSLEDPKQIEQNLRTFVHEALEDLTNADAGDITNTATS